MKHSPFAYQYVLQPLLLRRGAHISIEFLDVIHSQYFLLTILANLIYVIQCHSFFRISTTISYGTGKEITGVLGA
jgi:hypothetical protein